MLKTDVLLDMRGNNYVLHVGYHARDVLQPLGARWDVKQGGWLLPDGFSAQDLTRLKTVMPTIHVSALIEQQLQQKASKISVLSALQSAQDSTILCGGGLDPYQRVGIKFLVTAKKAILADPVGLGKSAQAIRAAQEAGAQRVLIVTKKSLIYNWLEQIGLWVVSENMPERFDVVNYEQVALNLVQYVQNKYDVLIIDEAHMIKNRGTRNNPVKRTKALHTLADKIPYVWLLTGTPILNRPDELWSLLHTTDKRKYSSYWQFVEKYCELDYHAWTGKRSVVLGVKPTATEALSQELASVLIRRTKATVALPPLTRETVYVTLESVQQEMYTQMLQEFFLLLDNVGVLHAPTVLAQFTRLRQLTCTPALLGGPDVSAKTTVVLDFVESYADEHKILVFSEFAKYVDILHKALAPYGAVKITGDMSARRRDESIQQLNADPACRVLVGTLGAMGVGLNIQTASVVITTDRSWVPAVMEQAEGRAHRRGQTKPVHVIDLHASGTLDDHIAAVLTKKEGIIDTVDVIMQMLRTHKSNRGRL